MTQKNQNFLLKILWTDEAIFRSNGGVNLHNMHYWSPTNPHWMQVHNQGHWSINVWCGIVNGMIIGPYFFEETLKGTGYLQFLRNELPVLLEEIDLQTRREIYFQHDGCSVHFTLNVREFLDVTFPGKWIGRGSSFPWPARSPDLTCLDFYLWGRLKDLVFQRRPTTKEDMRNRIRNAVTSITLGEIQTAIFSTKERLRLCIENNGKQFEHLKNN
ncbi:uncharacterized protein [Euwallacea similis]|uniref:uncharacterized protein n=1 Tax=Euwallacea similis TaxID=1736056 RepID=UPI00344E3922